MIIEDEKDIEQVPIDLYRIITLSLELSCI
jgi:hypothetical protein